MKERKSVSFRGREMKFTHSSSMKASHEGKERDLRSSWKLIHTCKREEVNRRNDGEGGIGIHVVEKRKYEKRHNIY